MAYQTAATAVIMNDIEGHSPVAGLFKYNPSNICAAFYTISTTVCSRGSSAFAEFFVLFCVSRPGIEVRAVQQNVKAEELSLIVETAAGSYLSSMDGGDAAIT